MKRPLLISTILVLSFCFFTSPSFGQELTERESKSETEKLEEKLLGVWRFDLPEQKEKLEPENRGKVAELSNKETENLWMKTDSRTYVFEPEGKIKVFWIDEGVFFEFAGEWKVEPKEMRLWINLEKEAFDYRVDFSEKGMRWIPNTKSEEFFTVLHLKSLRQ